MEVGICSQVIDELTEMMNMNKEQVEKTVHESKCDELSAMFNMMMDNKRKEKGEFASSAGLAYDRSN
jgi:hypothetical protein